MCAKSLCDPMDYSPPGSSVHRNSPGKNIEMGCHALLQGIFLTQGLNPCLLCPLHWQVDSLPWHHVGSPYGFREAFDDMYPPLQYQGEHFTAPKILFLPSSPWQPLMLLLLPECHIVGNITYVAFSDWLLSLSNIAFKFPPCLFVAS